MGRLPIVTDRATPWSRDLEEARRLVAGAGRVVVLTGAGVSAESGMPTFRGDGGLWKSHRPEELATPGAFARDPRLVWEWYQWRRDIVAGCDPNPAHLALARLALRRPDGVTLVTQNVDGLHHEAARLEGERLGTGPSHAYPLEVHGAIHRDRCSRCGYEDEEPEPVDASSEGALPRCPECGALLRPDVVWFGEALDPDVIGAAMDAAAGADVCLVVGTSALVHPAASIPQVTAEQGGRVVELNLDVTLLSPHAAVSLRGKAGELVPAVLDSEA